jgi:hypothetical protein
MIPLLLVACTGATPETLDSADSGDTTATTDTSPDTTEPATVWSKHKVDTSATIRGVYSSGSGVYLIGTRGQAWTGSASVDWTPLSLPSELGGVDLNSLWGAGAEDTLGMAVAADDGLVAIYSAGAWTTASLGTEDNTGVSGTSLTDLYVVGDNGIQHFDGTAWTVESTPPIAVNAIWASASVAYAVGAEGTVLKRSAGLWSAVDTGKVANFYAVAGTSSEDVWVVGDQGVAVHWDGSSWTQVETGTTETLNAVFAPDSNAVLAVGNGGTAIKWDGDAWTPLPTGSYQNLYAVHGISGSNAWAAGNGGLAIQYKAAE